MIPPDFVVLLVSLFIDEYSVPCNSTVLEVAISLMNITFHVLVSHDSMVLIVAVSIVKFSVLHNSMVLVITMFIDKYLVPLNSMVLSAAKFIEEYS